MKSSAIATVCGIQCRKSQSDDHTEQGITLQKKNEQTVKNMFEKRLSTIATSASEPARGRSKKKTNSVNRESHEKKRFSMLFQ